MIHSFTRWAATYRYAAIALIILFEVINGYLGTLLGANLLENLSGSVLQGGIVAIIGIVVYIRLWYLGAEPGPDRSRQRIKRICMFALFFGNFLLFTVIGGIGASRVQAFQPMGSVSATDLAVTPAVLRDSLPTATTRPPVLPLKKRQRQVPLTLLIAGQVILLGAGLFLAFLLVLLGCQLSCTGYGLGAVLITGLGLGVVGVLSFFWGRVWMNNLIRKTVPAERSQAARRYRRAWLATVLGILTVQALVTI